MEEVETLFNSVDKQNLQIWTNEFWDKIRKAERGMERSEKKWLLDQLTLVLAHLMGSLKEKKIASDDRSLLLFWLSYGNLSFSYDPRKGREFHKNFQGHARSLRFGRFFKNWYMMERSTQNPEGAIEVANYVRKYEIFDFDEFLRSTKITKSRPTKGGKRDIPETSTPLRPNTHPTSPNTPSSLLTPSRFAPSPCPSGPSLSLPLTPSTYSNTCFSTPTTSQKEKNFTPGPTSVPSSSSTSSSSSSKLKPCLRNKENAPESSERAQGLEHHVRLATDLKQPNGVLSEEPTPQKSSTGKKKGIHLKRMGLDGFQLKKAGEEEAKAKEAKKEEPTPLSSPTLDSSSDSPPHPSSSSLLTPSVSVSLPSPRSPLLSSSENIPQEQGKGEEREEQEREDPEKREMGELEREDREMEDREKEERERDAREKAEREREEQEVKEREEREREELEKEELEMEQLEREEREREEREKEEREKEEREREERRREQEKKKREQGERKKEESDKKEKEKIEKQEKMSQPIVSAILQHTPESIIEVNHNNYIKLEEIGKGGSATVYRVLDPALRCLALKCVDISSASEATIRGYVNEINHLKRVDQYNDHVILMHDFELCRERKIIRIVMELGEIDFQKFWKKHALEVLEKKLSWVKVMWQQMLEAVDSLHRCKVVHRDLKPANFVLCKGRLKLIDFGIAKEMDSGETKALCDQTVGTLNYMSPESLSSTGGNSFYLNRANDVWSLGCILYEMVYGMTPFQQYRTLITKLTKIQDPNHKISFPERFIGRGSTATQVVDRELLDVIRICLNRDMKARAHIADLLAHPFLKGKGAKVSKGGGVKRSGGKEGGEGRLLLVVVY